LFPALLTFASFCAAASGLYLINDLADLEVDRHHPRKRCRPFASGELPLQYGITSLFLVMTALAIGVTVSWGTLVIVLVYISMSLAYSNFIKTKPVADIFCLATLYTLRVVAGGVASGSHASVWLLNFTGFLFLSLGFLKRYAEYSQPNMANNSGYKRRGYRTDDSPLILMMGIGSSFIASMVLGLYVNSTEAHVAYRNPSLLWGLVPLTLFWQCRMWLASNRGHMHDDPIIFAAKDRTSHLVITIGVLIYVLATIDLNFFQIHR